MDGPNRVGDTVRRPRRPNTELVQRVLLRLQEAKVTWAPRPLGIDEVGREVQSWIPGDTPTTTDVDLAALIAIVRQLHDLTADLAGDAECIVHDDIQPRNIVVRGRTPVGLIDWEQARPGQRLEDVAKVCWAFVEPRPGADPVSVGERWRSLLVAYPFDRREELVTAVVAQVARCADDIERESKQGSVRHQVLRDRGDLSALRDMHGWVLENEVVLRNAIER